MLSRRAPVDGQIPEAVVRWQQAVHDPGVYDLELDSSSMTPEECAKAIRDRLLAGPPPMAFADLAAMHQDGPSVD